MLPVLLRAIAKRCILIPGNYGFAQILLPAGTVFYRFAAWFTVGQDTDVL